MALDPSPPAAVRPRNADVLVAELARERGECRAAAETYVKAAQASRDPRIARRATDVALECAHLPAAWKSATRWRELDPENVDALRAAGLVALELWRIDDARRLFRDLLGKPDVEPDRALGELLPLVLEGDHVAAAWLAFGPVVDRAAASPDTLVALARLAAAADNFDAAREILAGLPATGVAPAAASRRGAPARAARGGGGRRRGGAGRGAPMPRSSIRRRTRSRSPRPWSNSIAPKQAHAELERLQAQAATASEAERRLALLALGGGDFAEAQQRFGARLQRGESPAEALFYLGVIAERRGNDDLALQSYQRLAEAGAGLLPRARAASLLIERGERDKGLALLDDFAKGNRDVAIDAAVARAQLLADAGDFDAALASIVGGAEALPRSTRTSSTSGRCCSSAPGARASRCVRSTPC